jgi:transcriptional regulator with XRE-family HTH domain
MEAQFKRWTGKTRQDKVYKLKKAGLTDSQIARAYGISTERVRQIIKSKARYDEAVKLKKSGLSYPEIGQRLGVTESRVYQIIKGKSSKPSIREKVLLKLNKVADMTGLHPRTVARYGDQGLIKQSRIGPRRDRRFKREDVEAFLRERLNNR